MKNKFLKGLVASFAIALSGLANAGLITIDFESDVTGSIPNGFSSNDAAGVYFSDTLGAELALGDYGNQTDGIGLIVRGDDTSGLKIDFDFLISSLSLDFGNDDTCCASSGSLAYLTLFNNGFQVGSASVLMNLDDIMNQTISFSGLNFDRAEFFYVDAGFNPINLIEAVDNITFETVDVPEPSTLAIFALGIIGLASRKFKKQA